MSLQVLVACEFSGTVRDAFLAQGYDAWSCDIDPDEHNSNRHIRGDVRDHLDDGWDLLIVAHPPCTRLCNSGVRWLNDPSKIKNLGSDFTAQEKRDWLTMSFDEKRDLMWKKLDAGAALFSDCWNASIPCVAVENPVMHKYAKARIDNFEEFSQSIQPWQFGDWESKRTCLWLRNLPNLMPPYPSKDAARAALGLPADAEPKQRVHSLTPSENRAKERSRFFPGVARAMAEQWGPAAERLVFKKAA